MGGETNAFSISRAIAASSTGGRPRTAMTVLREVASIVGSVLVRVWIKAKRNKFSIWPSRGRPKKQHERTDLDGSFRWQKRRNLQMVAEKTFSGRAQV